MSAPRPSPSTVRVYEREAAAIGASLSWQWGRRHAFAIVTLPSGKTFRETVARRPQDDRTLKTWFRQAVARAERKAAP